MLGVSQESNQVHATLRLCPILALNGLDDSSLQSDCVHPLGFQLSCSCQLWESSQDVHIDESITLHTVRGS